MTATPLKRNGLTLSLVLGVIAFLADRGHKFYQIEMAGWQGGEFVHVTDFFDYVLVWNTGISYGLLDGLPIWVLLGLMSVAMVLLAIWWWRADTVLARFGLAICLGGATSHIIDRAIYGAVPDFFHFHLENWSFYIFNISDSMITIGVVILVLDMLMQARNSADQSQ